MTINRVVLSKTASWTWRRAARLTHPRYIFCSPPSTELFPSRSIWSQSATHCRQYKNQMSNMASVQVDHAPHRAHPDFPDAYPYYNPLDALRCAITPEIAKLSGVDQGLIFPGLAFASTLDRGDLVLPVARLRIKGKKPQELAQEWAPKFPANPSWQQPVAFDMFLTFQLSPEKAAATVLPKIFELGDKYGVNPIRGLKDPLDPKSGRKTVIVEFSSPNIAKEFHAGHLRSTIIGAFISNLYASNGWDVVRMNYLGDWGRQYGLLAIGWKRYGDEKEFEINPINHLYNIYVKISKDFQPEDDAYKAARKAGADQAELEKLETSGLYGEVKEYFKRMEAGDAEALALWKRFRDLSIEKYKTTYARLNIDFEEYSGESQVKGESMSGAEKVMQEKGILVEDNGAQTIDFKKHGAKALDVAIIRNRNGTSNYLLRDVGAAIQRYQKYHFDHMIYVVMAEQEMHLRRLFKILELMGGDYAVMAKKMQHVNFGKVLGMSTRRGTVKFLDDILADVGESMHEVMRKNEAKYSQVAEPEKVSETLGIAAVMVQDMSGKRVNNYPFQIERMTSFEGDTGPYLQYAHARLCSIQRKAGFPREKVLAANLSLLTEKHAVDLVRLMALYPDMIQQTLKTLEPVTVLTYLFRLTHQLSSAYDVLKVIGAEGGEEVALARAALYSAAQQVLSNGMRLLGLTPVERM